MNISVRVLSANAQAQIKALQMQVKALQAQLVTAGAAGGGAGAIGGARSRSNLIKYGNQMQWTGRQIQTNFTLPILLAAGAATKFALDNEKAMTRVTKVYGDNAAAAEYWGKNVAESTAFIKKNQEDYNKVLAENPGISSNAAVAQVALRNETDALADSFEALSNRYGVQQKEVIETASAWAAAGASGRDLAIATEQSIKASILGDMELAQATRSLISIQAQYSLSSEELTLALAELNAVENQTAITLPELITGFVRAAGQARETGVDIRHLAAMMAALTPAAGEAGASGNGLKTIISRLLAPTEEARKVMEAFGVVTADAGWKSATAVERLQILSDHMKDATGSIDTTSKAFQNMSKEQKYASVMKDASTATEQLSDAQKQVVAATLGSRYQVNRFLILMREMSSEHGNYAKALEATKDKEKVYAQANKELQAVLTSNPQKFKIIWANMQNGLASAITPMIPAFVSLAAAVGSFGKWLGSLSPSMQKFVVIGLLMLAVVGPLVRYFSSLLVLIGVLIMPFSKLIAMVRGLAVALVGLSGAQALTARGFIAMMGTMIAAPFKAVVVGIGGMYVALQTLWLWMMKMPLATRFWAAASAAAMAALPIMYAAASTAIIAVWRGVWLTMALVQTQGLGVMVKSWVASLVLMTRSVGTFSKITALFSGIWAGITLLFSRQMFMPLVMAMGRLTQTIELMLIGMWVSIKAIMVAGQAAMLTAWAAFRTAFLTGWAGFYIAWTTMTAKAHAFMVRMWAIFTGALSTVMASARGLIVATWASIQVAMQAVSMAFWKRIIAIWIAGALALPKILMAARNAITVAWAMIVAAQRTGALAAAAAAAGPWVALGVGIVAAIVIMRDQLKQIWQNIVSYFSDSTNAMTTMILKAWNALPSGIANALIAVANIVKTIALQIYEWFSYINPFAHHSPSLVENVTEGMKVVSDQFRIAGDAIGNHVKGAYRDVKAFGAAIRGILKGADSFEEAGQRAKIAKFAPAALDEFNKLATRLRQLKGDLEKIQPVMDRQQGVVDKWAAKVEAANDKLDAQQKILDKLQKVADSWSSKLEEAEGRLSDFANAPITGMKAMSDAIFENDMAQKALRLEMMRMEDVGGTYEDIQSKIESIQGAIELLKGEQQSLRGAGAGSDILASYDDQINALKAQQDQQTETAGTLADMNTQLDALARKGEMLDLENSLAFDPLTRQIEAAANAMEELPFDTIMAGVTAAAADIEYYGDKLDAATAAVAAQQATVDALTASRDALKDRLDAEEDKLRDITDRYNEVKDAISAVEQAMNDAAGAADKLDQATKAGKDGKLSPAEQNFKDAAGGNFADVGGTGSPIRTDYSDQTAAIQKETQRIADEAGKAFGSLNPFTGMKKYWNKFVDWLGQRWADFSAAFGDMTNNAFDGVSFGGFTDKMSAAWGKVKEIWGGISGWTNDNIIGPLKKVWELLGPSVIEFAQNAWNGIKKMFGEVWKELGPLFEEIGKMGPALKGFWNVAKIVLLPFLAEMLAWAKGIINILAKTVYPAFEMIGNILENVIQVVRGALQIISGFFMLFTGDWKEGFKKMGAGILNIFSGTFGAIGALIKGAFKIVVGAFWGIVDGIIDAAKWLWNVLVGHSIIPDIIKAIIWWFKSLISIVQWVWNNVISPLIGVFKKGFDLIVAALALWWEGMKLAWAAIATAGQWFWDNVLKPIYDFVLSIWNNYIAPAFGMWWDGLKAIWAGLATAGTWVWENVLKPIWNKISYLWELAKASFAFWWQGIKNVWSGLKTAGGWIWDNVLKPVYNKVTAIWSDYVKPAFAGWWGGIKTAWSSLTGLGKWVYDNVMKPVYDKITGVWSSIKQWFTDNSSMFTKPLKTIVNVVIDAVNAIIKGLNKVADILPGVDWDIGLITRLEQGGPVPTRRVGSGFKTNGARAIVGEGKANYPEFVIPTDPTHRRRATSLLLAAANKLGVGTGGDPSDIKRAGAGHMGQMMHGLPAFGLGGWISDKYNDAKDWVGDKLKELGKHAIGTVVNPLLNAGEKIIKPLWTPVRIPPQYGIDKVRSWVTDSDKNLTTYVDKAKKDAKYDDALAWARTKDYASYKMGAFGPDAYDCSGFMSALKNKIDGGSFRGTTGSFPFPGMKGGAGGKFVIGSTTNYGGSGVGHMAGTLNGVNVESRSGAGVIIGKGARGYNDRGFNQVYSMARGGIARARRGGVLANIAEGGYDEAVVPLPHNFRASDLGGGEKHFHFYGDLSFPNVKDGSDAETFLNNLEILAKD